MNFDNLLVKFTQASGKDVYSGRTIDYTKIGEVVEAPDWNDNPSCGGGIHFGRADVAFCALGSLLLGYWDTGAHGVDFMLKPEQRINLLQRAFQVESVEPKKPVEIIQDGKPTGKLKAKKVRVIQELDLVQALSWLSKRRKRVVRFFVACHHKTSAQDLTRLSKSKSLIRAAVAWNPSTPIPTLEKLSKSRSKTGLDIVVHEMLVLNPAVPESVLLRLSQRIGWLKKARKRVKQKIATFQRVPIRTLRVLVEDEKPEVRAAVAASPKANEEVLLKLVENKEFFVLNTIAARSDIPISVIERLVENEDWLTDFSVEHYGVKMKFVKNQSLPPDAMTKVAEATFSVSPRSKKGNCAGTIRLVMSNFRNCPHASPEALKILAKDKLHRSLVAQHPNTSDELYRELASQVYCDNSGSSGLVSSQHITRDIAERFLSHKSEWVVSSLIRNEKLPLEFLLKLLEPSPLYHRIKKGNRDEAREEVKVQLAYREDTPLAVRRKLAQDKSTWVREAVAQSPYMPPEILENLARDKQPLVSAVARKRLS